MIFTFTAEDKERLERLRKIYTKRLEDNSDLLIQLRPGDNGPGGPEGAVPGSDEEKQMTVVYEKWLSEGSPEWRAARVEQTRILNEYSMAISSFYARAEKAEFAKFGGNREKILDSAREQIPLYIESQFKKYMDIISTGRDSDGDEITGFSARDVRVDKKKIYLDTAEVTRECKEILLKLHYEALADDPAAIKELDDIVLSIITDDPRTSSDKGDLGGMFEVKIKNPRRQRSKKKIPAFDAERAQDFFMFPTTQGSNLIYSLFAHNGDLEKTAEEVKAVGKLSTGSVTVGPSAIAVQRDSSTTIIEILESKRQEINGRASKKIFHFIVDNIYKTTYYKGVINSDLVTFPLQNMVDRKLYTSVKNARRAFYEASDSLTALRVSATIKTGSRSTKTSEDNGRAVLFPTMYVKNGQCFVRLNKDIKWTPILKDFSLLPDSWYSLPDNASDLEYNIFRTMRLQKGNIDSKGVLKFNIKLSSVAAWLNLPLNTKNPKKNVKVPIETAIDHVLKSLDQKHFKITIKTDLNAPLSQYLDGYLEVKTDGIYTENLLTLSAKQREIVEKNVEKKERIVEEASIRSLADKMKNEASEEPKSPTCYESSDS